MPLVLPPRHPWKGKAREGPPSYGPSLTLGLMCASLLLMYLIVTHVVDRAAVSSRRLKSHQRVGTDGSTSRDSSDGSSPSDPKTRRKGPANATSSVLEGVMAPLISGGQVDLGAAYYGHVVLVVNVASHCGFTALNYRELELLYQRYKKQRFVVLAFPCNQFGEQEADPPRDIEFFVRRKQHATFPLFGKVDVNGDLAFPLYRALKTHLKVKEIEWNFGKFLIGRDGIPLRYYPHDVSFSIIESDLKAALDA